MSGKKSTGAGNGASKAPGKKAPRKYASTAHALLLGTREGKASEGKKRPGGKLRFGLVEARAARPHPDVKSANIASGQEALKRAKKAFTNKGVSLRHRKSVPVFFADPKDPSVLIRRLEGREERGRLVNGAFVPAG
jgi:hypothetical protein